MSDSKATWWVWETPCAERPRWSPCGPALAATVSAAGYIVVLSDTKPNWSPAKNRRDK